MERLRRTVRFMASVASTWIWVVSIRSCPSQRAISDRLTPICMRSIAAMRHPPLNGQASTSAPSAHGLDMRVSTRPAFMQRLILRRGPGQWPFARNPNPKRIVHGAWSTPRIATGAATGIGKPAVAKIVSQVQGSRRCQPKGIGGVPASGGNRAFARASAAIQAGASGSREAEQRPPDHQAEGHVAPAGSARPFARSRLARDGGRRCGA